MNAADAPIDEELPWKQLGAPARRALAGAGYSHLKDLTKVTEDQIQQLHGIGPKALKTLRDALAAQDLSYADPVE